MKYIYQYPKLRICNNCNSLFEEYSITFFCCNVCKMEFLRKQKYKNKPKYRQTKILPFKSVFKIVKKTCEHCNKDISDMQKNTKFCSKKCKKKASKEQKEHEKNIM